MKIAYSQLFPIMNFIKTYKQLKPILVFLFDTSYFKDIACIAQNGMLITVISCELQPCDSSSNNISQM